MDDADVAQLREQFQREAALARLRAELSANEMSAACDGDREFCEGCGDPIPPERRRAIPGATRCTTCQEVHERTMRMRG